MSMNVDAVKQPVKRFDFCYTQHHDAVSSHGEKNGTSEEKFILLILRQNKPCSPMGHLILY